MKTKMRNRLISAALSMMMVMTPVGGAVFAADEAVTDNPVSTETVVENTQESQPAAESNNVAESQLAAESNNVVESKPAVESSSVEESKPEAGNVSEEVSKAEIKEEVKEETAISSESAEVSLEAANQSAKSAAVTAEAVNVENASDQQSENPENIQAEDAGEAEEAEEIEAAAPKGPVSAATKAAEANTGTGANADGKVTVHYTYGLSALAKYRVDGKVTPFEYTLSMVKGQSKLQTGAYSYMGGKNYSFSDMGVKYIFQNAFVESCALDNSGDITPVFKDSTDENGNPIVSESTMVTKVQNKGNGEVVLTYADGSTKTLTDMADLYLSPVYERQESWHLEYKYIDNISTGSGSWSNKDAIASSYSHTFANPEIKSPRLTNGKYRFEYWMTDETGEKFFDGDKFTYTGAGQKAGTTRTIETYAYWQPAVAVRYIVDGAVAETARSFDENIDIAASYNGADLDDEDYRFSGWYGDSGKIEDGDMALLPEITKEAGTYAEHDVTAFWQPAITIAYHVLDSVETVKDFGEIGVYGKTAEAGEKMRFDGWFDEDGNRIDDDAVMSAPAITAMKAGAAVINVFARFTEIKEEVVPEEEIIPSTDNETPAAPAAPATPAAPAASETVQRTNTAAPAVNRAATVIADNATPKAETVFEGTEAEAAVIEDAAAPLAAPEHNWALINLIAMIAAVVGSIIASFRKKEENEDNAEEDDENRNMGRVRAAKAAGLLAGAVSMIAFFLTEDMSLPMVLADRWTILMIIILAVQAVSAALVKKACESEDDEEAEAEAVAAEM